MITHIQIFFSNLSSELLHRNVSHVNFSTISLSCGPLKSHFVISPSCSNIIFLLKESEPYRILNEFSDSKIPVRLIFSFVSLPVFAVGKKVIRE